MTRLEQIDERIRKLENEEPIGTECEVYTRIVGYYRSLRAWNTGKREEYRHRRVFTVPESPHKGHDGSVTDAKRDNRNTFRPDQAGALPIVGEFQQMQLGK